MELIDTMISENYVHAVYSDVLEMLGLMLRLILRLRVARCKDKHFRDMSFNFQTFEKSLRFILKWVNLTGVPTPLFAKG